MPGSRRRVVHDLVSRDPVGQRQLGSVRHAALLLLHRAADPCLVLRSDENEDFLVRGEHCFDGVLEAELAGGRLVDVVDSGGVAVHEVGRRHGEAGRHEVALDFGVVAVPLAGGLVGFGEAHFLLGALQAAVLHSLVVDGDRVVLEPRTHVVFDLDVGNYRHSLSISKKPG